MQTADNMRYSYTYGTEIKIFLHMQQKLRSNSQQLVVLLTRKEEGKEDNVEGKGKAIPEPLDITPFPFLGDWPASRYVWLLCGYSHTTARRMVPAYTGIYQMRCTAY